MKQGFLSHRKTFGAVLFAAGIAVWIFLLSPPAALALGIGNSVPGFQVHTIDGKTLSYEDFKGRKPVYLIFWATW